jgi:fumarate hydratase class I
VKLASTRYLDELPTEGSKAATPSATSRWRRKVHKLTQQIGVGAQFGGKYFCHDVRVIRLPRHGASLPIGIGVSCSADRQAQGKITPDGVFIEQLEHDPAQYPAGDRRGESGRRGRQDRPQPADGRHPGRALEAPGEDPRLADRHHRRRARHRARQDPRAAGRAKACRTT